MFNKSCVLLTALFATVNTLPMSAAPGATDQTSMLVSAKAPLPLSMDLSGHLPLPGDMGHQNSTVGWAVAYVMSYRENQKEAFSDPRLCFSPAFIYNQINNGRDDGATFEDALALVTDRGAVSLADMPYDVKDFQRQPGKDLLEKARRYKAKAWRKVDIHNPQEIKALISTGFPLLLGMMIDEGMLKMQPGEIWHRVQGRTLGGAAMVLAGYDDNRKAFKLLNAWGKSWGEHGYVWIDYSFFSKVVREGYILQKGPELPAT